MNGLNHTGYIGLFKEFKRIHKWESSTCSFAWILTTSYMFILNTTCMFESVLSLLSTVTLLNRIQYMYSKMHSYQNHRCPRHILRFVHTLCFPFSWSPTLLIELTITKNSVKFYFIFNSQISQPGSFIPELLTNLTSLLQTELWYTRLSRSSFYLKYETCAKCMNQYLRRPTEF